MTTAAVAATLNLIQRYENAAGLPNLGTGNHDLTPYILAGNVDAYGFPNWPGIATPKGVSTAAGLYQITKTTWDQYAPVAGVSDFSPNSQQAVAEAILNTSPTGLANWTCCNAALAAAVQSTGAGTTGIVGGNVSVTGNDPTNAGFDFLGTTAPGVPSPNVYTRVPGAFGQPDTYTAPGGVSITSDQLVAGNPASSTAAQQSAAGGGYFSGLTTYLTSSAANVVLALVALLLLVMAIWPRGRETIVAAAKAATATA